MAGLACRPVRRGGSCGPGNTHLIQGVMDAHRSGAPVLVLASPLTQVRPVRATVAGVRLPNVTDNETTGSTPSDEGPGPSPRQDPGTFQPAEDPGYLIQTGDAVGEDGSVVPIIGGLPAVEGSAWDIGASADDRGAELAAGQGAGVPLDEDTIRLAKGKNLATVVTLMPGGQPQALLTWVDTDGEHILVNTEPTRQRYRNVTRDPRITVLIHSADNPWDWSEVRGHVAQTVRGGDARRHIDELSRKYTGQDYQRPVGPEGRVILKVAPDKINTPKLLGR
jgi:PPOX class probable F420-dependent enzyme